jgi:hypothetical protein
VHWACEKVSETPPATPLACVSCCCPWSLLPSLPPSLSFPHFSTLPLFPPSLPPSWSLPPGPSWSLLHQVRAGRDLADSVLRDMVTSRLGRTNGASFADIAATADAVGRPTLAALLLDYEPRIADQV